jgi:propanol-preferring alcohol dehydrogenase
MIASSNFADGHCAHHQEVSMKAYRLNSPARIETNPLEVDDLPLPQPGPGQVRIRVALCGVCHTDLHTAEGEINPPHLPVTLGHQVVGVVDALHASVTQQAGSLQRGNLRLGQRVGIPWLYSACGSCDYCLRGKENLCPNAKFSGFHVDGGYAEYMLADARYALPIPDSLSSEQAAPLLCAGIVGYRSLKKAEVLPGEHVGLFGFGASGHLCIQMLKHWGCRVSVFTRAIAHQAHARELGAAWAGSAGQNPDKPLDRAVIFAPTGGLVVRALETIRPGGTVAINAIHMSDIPSFPYEKIYGERTVRSVANATYQDGEEFLALAVSAGIRSTVNIYPLKDANLALQDLKASRFNGEAVLKVN